jgi:hypothetical protein
MTDPLAEVVTLLQPGAQFSKLVSGAGPWRVRRTETGRPFYCVILEGSCRLAVDGREPLGVLRTLQPRSRRCPYGVPTRLAHGHRQGPPAAQRRSCRRRCRTRRLQLRKYVQRCIHPLCRTAANTVCAGAGRHGASSSGGPDFDDVVTAVIRDENVTVAIDRDIGGQPQPGRGAYQRATAQ